MRCGVLVGCSLYFLARVCIHCVVVFLTMQEGIINASQGFAIGYKGVLATAKEPLTLGKGTYYLLARNGRGKTTLLRTLAGVLRPLKGDVVVVEPRHFVPEDIAFDPELSARQILGALVTRSRLPLCIEWAERLELNISLPYRNLSTGNQRKVSWLMAEFVASDGDVVLLDEPFTGLDSYAREIIMEYWEGVGSRQCRVVSCHPDFDSMAISSAVLISNGEITLETGDRAGSWGEFKGRLV